METPRSFIIFQAFHCKDKMSVPCIVSLFPIASCHTSLLSVIMRVMILSLFLEINKTNTFL